jgi:hypothetical protein
VAAVLFGESVRLLHEVTRYLEQGQQNQQLPPLLVPSVTAAPMPPQTDMPNWAMPHAILREVHEGLRGLGLRVECDHETIRYFPRRNGQTPFALLAPARRDGIARLFLRADSSRPLPASPLQIIPPKPQPDPLNTIIIIATSSSSADVLSLAKACLDALK